MKASDPYELGDLAAGAAAFDMRNVVDRIANLALY
jgi:hypothetical protein